MKKVLLFLTVLTVLISLAIPAAAFEVGVRGYYWWPGLSGNLKVDAAGITGTSIDLEDDLGMSDESYPVIEVFAGLGNHHFSVAYYSADYDGSKTLTKSINFNGQTFTAGTLVTSSLDYDVYDFMYQYDLLDLENFLAGGSLGVVGKVKLFDGNASVQSNVVNSNVDFTAPIPMVGLNFHVGILADILEARFLLAGIGYSGGKMYECQADISYTPFPFLDIHGGYRMFVIDVDVDDLEADYKTSGPYVALTVSF